MKTTYPHPSLAPDARNLRLWVRQHLRRPTARKPTSEPFEVAMRWIAATWADLDASTQDEAVESLTHLLSIAMEGDGRRTGSTCFTAAERTRKDG